MEKGILAQSWQWRGYPSFRSHSSIDNHIPISNLPIAHSTSSEIPPISQGRRRVLDASLTRVETLRLVLLCSIELQHSASRRSSPAPHQPEQLYPYLSLCWLGQGSQCKYEVCMKRGLCDHAQFTQPLARQTRGGAPAVLLSCALTGDAVPSPPPSPPACECSPNATHMVKLGKRTEM